MLIPEDIVSEEQGIAPRPLSPVFSDPDRPSTRRSENRRELIVRSWFTLRKGQKYLDVHTKVDNVCKNHRLRVTFPTRLAATHSYAEAAFDVIEREIVRTPKNPYYNRENPQYPNHRFVDVSDGKMGLALINDGNVDEAMVLSQELLEFVDKTYRKDARRKATTYNNMGMVFLYS